MYHPNRHHHLSEIIKSLIRLFICSVVITTAPTTIQAQYQPKTYEVTKLEYHLPEVLDSSNPNVVIVLPKQIIEQQQQVVEKFPMLIFAHGFTGGNRATYGFHRDLLRTISSYGFIVLAPKSCSYGCPGFGRWSTYDDEILHLLDWVMETKSGTIQQPQDVENILAFVNHTSGYGIFGHSAGGQATVRALDTITKSRASSSVQQPSKYDNVFITGLIMNIPQTNVNDIQIQNIPFAAFTGTKDRCCGSDKTKPAFDVVTNSSKLYANFINVRHGEPTQLGKKRYTLYIVAWFQLFLSYRYESTNNTNNLSEDFMYYYNLIVNTNDPNSICSATATAPKVQECIVQMQ